MRQRFALLISVCIVVGSLILALFLNQPSVGQAPAAPAGKVGKYQVSVALTDRSALVIMCDTETGELWRCTLATKVALQWTPIDSPVQQKRK